MMMKLTNEESGMKMAHLYYNQQLVQSFETVFKHDEPVHFAKAVLTETTFNSAALNLNDGTLIWSYGALSAKEYKRFPVPIQPDVWIDFPILCYVKPDHRKRELVIKNLSDKDTPERTFCFEDIRFVCFLGFGRLQAESRVAFLAKNIHNGDLNLVLLRQDKPFEKVAKCHDDLGRWQVQKFTLNPFQGLKNHLSEVKKAFFVEENSKNTQLRNQNRQGSILFSTEQSIYLAKKNEIVDIRAAQGATSDHKLVKI